MDKDVGFNRPYRTNGVELTNIPPLKWRANINRP